jgi:hypothetical protein
MKKTLILMLILYLFYLVFFTKFSFACETMIDLKALRVNQHITFADKNNIKYVIIRLSSIVNANNESNNELISNLYEKISKSEQNYDTFTEQDSKFVIESLKKGYTQIIREPLLAIKITDAKKLTNDNIITGSIRNVNNKSILLPFLSKNNPIDLDGNIINNRIIKLDKLLFLDQDSKVPSNISDLKKVYLHPIYKVGDIDIYLIKDSGEPNYELTLY